MSLVAHIVLVGISSALYFGLAVLGWGGFHAFFSHEPLAVLAAGTFAIMFIALFAGGSISSGVREDRGNRWVLWTILAIGLADGYLPAWADRAGVWPIGGEAVRWTGVGLFFLGCGLRLWPVFVLGNRFSGLVAIQPGHRLATRGIYSVIRHPSYLGLLVTALGWGVAFDTWVGVILAALIVPPIMGRIAAEERMLASEFGAEYAAYRARTSRLVPGVY